MHAPKPPHKKPHTPPSRRKPMTCSRPLPNFFLCAPSKRSRPDVVLGEMGFLLEALAAFGALEPLAWVAPWRGWKTSGFWNASGRGGPPWVLVRPCLGDLAGGWEQSRMGGGREDGSVLWCEDGGGYGRGRWTGRGNGWWVRGGRLLG